MCPQYWTKLLEKRGETSRMSACVIFKQNYEYVCTNKTLNNCPDKCLLRLRISVANINFSREPRIGRYLNVSWRVRPPIDVKFRLSAFFGVAAMHSRSIDDKKRNCSPNSRDLSRNAYPATFLGSIRFSCSAKEVIRMNRCFLYAQRALSFSLSRTFIFMIDNDPTRSEPQGEHADLAIRHVYNRSIINHARSSFLSVRRNRERRSSKSAIHSGFINKDIAREASNIRGRAHVRIKPSIICARICD